MRRTATLLLLLVAACGGSGGDGFTYKGDLTDLGPAPDFHLLERAGVPLDTEDLLGKVWTCTFIFTRCQSHCILLCTEMAKLQDEFEKEPDFRMVAVTVDPAYDKPDVLKAFAKSWDADAQKWLFLWGRAEDIKAVMGEKGFKVGWQDEMVNHSLRVMLVDRKGRIRGSYMGNDRERMKKLREDIRALLREK